MKEFHDEVLFDHCALVACVGLGEEHLEGALFSLAHHAVLQYLEGRSLAIYFGESQFTRLLCGNADLVANLIIVDKYGRVTAFFRFRDNFNGIYLVEVESGDAATSAFRAKVIHVFLHGLAVLDSHVEEVVHCQT